jgi:hypothetical protein
MVALRIVAILAALGLAVASRAKAEAGEFLTLGDLFSKTDFGNGRAEFSNGFDVNGNSWSAYASAVFGLTSPLHTDGWRLKFSGIYGRYAYNTRNPYICMQLHDPRSGLHDLTLAEICDDIANQPPAGEQRDAINATLAPYGMQVEGDQIVATTPRQATHYNLAVAPGYQATVGRVILRGYLGVAFEQQDIAPIDPGNLLAGTHWGAQGWAEAWLPFGESAFLSADGGYFTGTASYSAAMKFGVRPLTWLTFGPELAAFGDSEGESARAGGFLRFDVSGWETTLSGGLSGDYRNDPAAYGSANLFVRF